jgi:hypothetical protein
MEPKINFGDLTPYLTYAYNERPKTYVNNGTTIFKDLSFKKPFQNSMIILKIGPVLYLGLKLTIHVIKSQIHLVRQSLFISDYFNF